MANRDVIEFIQSQREEGTSDEEIFRALNVIGGWDKEDFDDAIREIDGVSEPVVAPAPVAPTLVQEEKPAAPDIQMPTPAQESVASQVTPQEPVNLATVEATMATPEPVVAPVMPPQPIVDPAQNPFASVEAPVESAPRFQPELHPRPAKPTPVVEPAVEQQPVQPPAPAMPPQPVYAPPTPQVYSYAQPQTAPSQDGGHPTLGLSLENMYGGRGKRPDSMPAPAPIAPQPINPNPETIAPQAVQEIKPTPEVVLPTQSTQDMTGVHEGGASVYTSTVDTLNQPQAPILNPQEGSFQSMWPTQQPAVPPVQEVAPVVPQTQPGAGGYVNPAYMEMGQSTMQQGAPVAADPKSTPAQVKTKPTGLKNYKKIFTFLALILVIAVAGYFFVKSQRGLASTLMSKISFMNKKDKDFLKSISSSKMFADYPALTVRSTFNGTLSLKGPAKKTFAAIMGEYADTVPDQQKISYVGTRDFVRFGSGYHERTEGELTIGKHVIPFEMVIVDPVVYVRRTAPVDSEKTTGISRFTNNTWFMIDPRRFADAQFDSVDISSFSGDTLTVLFKKMLSTLNSQSDDINIAKSDANPNRVQYVYDGALATTIDKFQIGDWVKENFSTTTQNNLIEGISDLLMYRKVSQIDMGIDESTKDPLTLSYRTVLTGNQAEGAVFEIAGTVNHIVSSRLQSTGSTIEAPGTPAEAGDMLVHAFLAGDDIESPDIAAVGPQKPVEEEVMSDQGEIVVDVIGALTRNRQKDLDAQIEGNLGKVTKLAQAFFKKNKTYTGMCAEDESVKLLVNDTKNLTDGLLCEDGEKGYRVTARSVTSKSNLYCVASTTKKVVAVASPEEPFTFNCVTGEDVMAKDQSSDTKMMAS